MHWDWFEPKHLLDPSTGLGMIALALGLFSFMAGRENMFELIMAGSVLMTMPVIIIFFLAQRHFI
ncbi:MAG: carbohydrate ABC transporter permease, partial [Proteobacteria bacterium]|nr:carbohydrate ABC transporter permease [Pseudomonadota bacterium]